MAVELNETESALALHVIEQAYQDLREEIYKTEGTDFKAQLKERERRLAGLMEKLRG